MTTFKFWYLRTMQIRSSTRGSLSNVSKICIIRGASQMNEMIKWRTACLEFKISLGKWSELMIQDHCGPPFHTSESISVLVFLGLLRVEAHQGCFASHHQHLSSLSISFKGWLPCRLIRSNIPMRRCHYSTALQFMCLTLRHQGRLSNIGKTGYIQTILSFPFRSWKWHTNVQRHESLSECERW